MMLVGNEYMLEINGLLYYLRFAKNSWYCQQDTNYDNIIGPFDSPGDAEVFMKKFAKVLPKREQVS